MEFRQAEAYAGWCNFFIQKELCTNRPMPAARLDFSLAFFVPLW
jgi:hypothetical protein